MTEDALDLTRAQVRAAQKGDAAAIDGLFARYLPRVRRMVASRMRMPVSELAEVEDVVQETMLDALACGSSHINCPRPVQRRAEPSSDAVAIRPSRATARPRIGAE